MDCDAARPLLQPYLDGELDAAAIPALETHLETCAECREVLARIEAVGAAVRAQATYYRAPAGLQQRLSGIGAEAVPATAPVVPLATARRWRNFGIGSLAGSLAMLAASLMLYLSLPGMQSQIADEVVASHVRSLMAGHLTDVASSDHHTVKPWFDGKLDLAPPVVDLAKDGFPLQGGRLDYIDHRPVAALAYRHGKHVINLFILPASGDLPSEAEAETVRGYNLLRWSLRGLDYWAVTDMEARELADWERDWRQAIATAGN